jgi:uncharacterized protein (DUF1778 family)
MTTLPDTPVSLTVRVPHERPLRYGVHSTSHHTAKRQMLRFAKEEFDLVEKASHILGIELAVFTREAAINTAKALIKQMENHNANHTDRGG